jgi:spore coat polysaccharide biosynthesis protein SpsF (cytidylyltransferase family)
MKTVAIIQARMGSSRLPGKVLLDLEGMPLIQRIVNKVLCSNVDEVVVATTKSVNDDKLVKWCKGNSVSFFRGSECNVLERYYECAKFYDADNVVRVTSDDPFKDPLVINKAIDILIDGQYDYVSNTIHPTFPEGVDIEVFTFNTLERCFNNATLDSEKEHVTPYIWKNDSDFSLYNFTYKRDLSLLRWTIDYKEDLDFSKAVYKHLKNKECFSMEDVLSILKQYPELYDLQKSVVRNEGYVKSIKEGK